MFPYNVQYLNSNLNFAHSSNTCAISKFNLASPKNNRYIHAVWRYVTLLCVTSRVLFILFSSIWINIRSICDIQSFYTDTSTLCPSPSPFTIDPSLRSRKSEQWDTWGVASTSDTEKRYSLTAQFRRKPRLWCTKSLSGVRGQSVDLQPMEREERDMGRPYVTDFRFRFLFLFTCARRTRVQYDMASRISARLLIENRRREWEGAMVFPRGSSSRTGHYRETKGPQCSSSSLKFCACAQITICFCFKSYLKLTFVRE